MKKKYLKSFGVLALSGLICATVAYAKLVDWKGQTWTTDLCSYDH